MKCDQLFYGSTIPSLDWYPECFPSKRLDPLGPDRKMSEVKGLALWKFVKPSFSQGSTPRACVVPAKKDPVKANTTHQQQGTKSKLLLETKLPPSFPWAWPLSLAGPSLARPPTLHPGISCSSTKAAAHIWAQQDSLQQTHFYCSRLFLRPRVLEMKGSLLWSWEIRDSAGVLCLGGKACELRLGWMLMLA